MPAFSHGERADFRLKNCDVGCSMKRQKAKFKQSPIGTKFSNFADTPAANAVLLPEAKESEDERRNATQHRRKTRSHALRETKAKPSTVNNAREYCDVSIETLHSICAPARSKQEKKQQSSWSTSHQYVCGFTGQCLSSSVAHSWHTARSAQNDTPQDEFYTTATQMPSMDPWLEVCVETEDGIDLIVDLDYDGLSAWLLEKNSCMSMNLGVTDEFLKPCSRQSLVNDSLRSSHATCYDSCNTELPLQTRNLQTNMGDITSVPVDSGMASETAQIRIPDGYVTTGKLTETSESQECSTSEIEKKTPNGLSLESLAQMPTFVSSGMIPLVGDTMVVSNFNWMMICLEV